MKRQPNRRAGDRSKTEAPSALPPHADTPGATDTSGPLPGWDQTWRFRQWLLEAAFLAAHGDRPDLSDEHFVSLADEAISSLPDRLFGAALQLAI